MRTGIYSEAEKAFIYKNAHKYTSKELANILDRSHQSVITYLIGHNISYIKRNGISNSKYPFGLTPKQNQIMEYVAQGYSNQELCNLFKVSMSTIKTHIITIYGKMGLFRTDTPEYSVQRVRAVLKWLKYKQEGLADERT